MPTSGLDGLARVPHVALDDDGLDILELALIGALPALPMVPGVPDEGELVLTDSENTPLAHLRVSSSGGRDIVPLRPLAGGTTGRWDPAYRRRPEAVRAWVSSRGNDRPVLAIMVDDAPTIADTDAITALVERLVPASVLCIVPVARRPRGVGRVGWDGLVRCAMAMAETIATTRPGTSVLPLVVPWPGPSVAATAGVHLADVLATFGVTERHDVLASRTADASRRIAALATAHETAVRDLYADAIATEVLKVSRPTDAPARGAVVLFTGLSGSGKSTIARALADDLAEALPHRVTLLDGDDVRRSLSSHLGFDVASREANIDRIGYVASLISEHGGIAIAAPIAPFAASRGRARERAEAVGAFVLVHVSTPLEVCEARDRKGLYARARAGEIADFTGISSPYEAPTDADVTVDTSTVDVATAATLVRAALERRLAQAGPGTD